MTRVAALIGAILLVVGALWIHGDLDGGSDDGGDGGGGSGRTPRLLCASELGAVCSRIEDSGDVEVQTEPAGVSLTRLATLPDSESRDPGFDGWLAPYPAPEIVRDSRVRAQLSPMLSRDQRAIADSRLVLAIWKDRERVLADRCGGTIGWRCIGDVAGRPWADIGGEAAWGTVKPGHESPETTATGIDVIGQAASEYFGRTDLSTVDYEDGAFLGWFSRLERSVRFATGSTAFQQMLAAGPAAFDVVGTTDAEARPLLAHASADRRRNVDLLYPAPVARVDAVFAPVAGSEAAGELRDIVDDAGRRALEQEGWDVSRSGGRPRHENLPDAGSLQALLETWREVAG